MMHPHTELRFINPLKGFGVVATHFIPKGTITWIMDELDRTFSPDEIGSFDALYQETLHKYCYRNNEGSYVLCWDIARFVNHSYRSNCMSTAYNFELAIRDIYPGEELTDDYGYLNTSEPLDFPAEEGSSRTQVLPDDILTFHKEWDRELEETFGYFSKVPQPLESLIPPDIRKTVEAVAAGKQRMESILSCHYSGDAAVKR
jgi:uncharacterized protein